MTRGSCISSPIPAYCAFTAEQNGQRRLSLLFYTDVSRFYGFIFLQVETRRAGTAKIAMQHRERVNKELVLANRLVFSADWWTPRGVRGL